MDTLVIGDTDNLHASLGAGQTAQPIHIGSSLSPKKRERRHTTNGKKSPVSEDQRSTVSALRFRRFSSPSQHADCPLPEQVPTPPLMTEV